MAVKRNLRLILRICVIGGQHPVAARRLQLCAFSHHSCTTVLRQAQDAGQSWWHKEESSS